MGFQLHDWNDAKLLLAVAELGSFAAVSAALNMDQVTISRRIANLEAVAGRPLFTRKRSGAKPTPAGMAVIAAASNLATAMRAFENTLGNLDRAEAPPLTIAASEGVLNFLLKPALTPQARTRKLSPLSGEKLLADGLPPLTFSELSGAKPALGDISIVPTNPHEVPNIRGRYRVRRIGTMSFVPVASRKFMVDNRVPNHFDALKDLPLIDNGTYRGLKAMEDWHGLVSHSPQVIAAATTSDAVTPLRSAKGITLLPAYATHMDKQGVILDITTPFMAVDLWATAHEDTLREPTARRLYDGIADMFTGSPWFKSSSSRAGLES